MIYCLSMSVGMLEPHQKAAPTSGLNEMAMTHMSTQVKIKEGEMTLGGCAGRTLFERGLAENGQDLDLGREYLERGYVQGILGDQEKRHQTSSYNVAHLKLR